MVDAVTPTSPCDCGVTNNCLDIWLQVSLAVESDAVLETDEVLPKYCEPHRQLAHFREVTTAASNINHCSEPQGGRWTLLENVEIEI